MAVFYDRKPDAIEALFGPTAGPYSPPGQSRRYPRQAVICVAGEPAHRVFLIRRGWVRLSFDSENGQEITLAILGPGQLVGEMEALHDTDRQYTVVALSPCEIQSLRATEFKHCLRNNPALANQLIRRLALRMHWTEKQLQYIASRSVAARLAHVLLSLAGEPADAARGVVRIPIRLTHYDLATLVASTRETITTTLGMFRRTGLIAADRKGLRILNHRGLSSMATR